MSKITLILKKEAEKEKNGLYVKRYKCPYCEERLPKGQLILHVEEEHEDMIPKDMTPHQVVFNHIYKKDHSTCKYCKKEIREWDEDAGRYKSFCDSKCSKAYADSRKDYRLKVGDVDRQKTMLHKKHNTYYTFTNGKKIPYVGTYEQAFLEFMDVVMKANPDDILYDTPVIEYKYKGETHYWIMDFYYVPYNLAIDIKDGGDNPNNRPMMEYREKQLAKEEAIKEQGEYNYLRCTDKNFSQLMSIMAEFKMMGLDNDRRKIVRVHEHSIPAMAALPPFNPDNIYIVNYMMHNTFTHTPHYAVCRDYMQDLFTIDDNEGLKRLNIEDLMLLGKDVKVFKYIGDKTISFEQLLRESAIDTDFYTKLTGKILYDYDQIVCDESFQEVLSQIEIDRAISECVTATLLMKDGNIKAKGINIESVPVLESGQYFGITQDNSDIEFRRDLFGVYARNTVTGIRSMSRNSIQDIPQGVIKIIQ